MFPVTLINEESLIGLIIEVRLLDFSFVYEDVRLFGCLFSISMFLLEYSLWSIIIRIREHL